MSIVRCNYCDKNIDTDQDAEHFVANTEHCLIQVQDAAPELLKACKIADEYHGYTMVDGTEEQVNDEYEVSIILKEAIKKATKI